jgi:hypothetical protein
VHVVVPDGHPRGGLPVWPGAKISSLALSDLKGSLGDVPVYGQQDVLHLLMAGATWEVSYLISQSMYFFVNFF